MIEPLTGEREGADGAPREEQRTAAEKVAGDGELELLEGQ